MTEESLRLGVTSGWYSTKVSGTFVSGPHDSEAGLPAQDRRDQSAAAEEKKMSTDADGLPFRLPMRSPATLARGSVRGYEYDRMVLIFSMMDGAKEVPCAVSASAMDDLEHVSADGAGAAREQFLRFARPDRTARIAQIPGPGSSRASRPASFCAASIFVSDGRSGLLLAAMVRAKAGASLDWSVALADITGCLGTLHPRHRCHSIPKRNGIGDRSPSVVPT